MNLDTAKAIFARHADKFITAYVFGSVAAGTADEQRSWICAWSLERPTCLSTPPPAGRNLAEEGRYFVKESF